MNNYIIYRIRDKTTGDTYIGSTRMSLEERIKRHKRNKLECKSKPIIDKDNYTVKVLLKMYCSKTTARWLERFSMKNHYNVVNSNKSITTREEKLIEKREYCKNEEFKKYQKEYRKQQRALKQTTYHCPCGQPLKITNNRERQIKRHEEGIRHINRMKKKNNQ